jgi:hypothetical protein
LTNMGIFLNTAKADRFSYLHENGKNRPVQLLETDRQKPVRTGRFNFIDRTGYNSESSREFETEAAYIFSGRYTWDRVEVLDIFTWKSKVVITIDRLAGLKSGPVSVRSLERTKRSEWFTHKKYVILSRYA